MLFTLKCHWTIQKVERLGYFKRTNANRRCKRSVITASRQHSREATVDGREQLATMDYQLAPAGIPAMAGQNMLAMAPAASTSCGRVLFHIARPAVRSIISTREYCAIDPA
jgi:hypothetical protein